MMNIFLPDTWWRVKTDLMSLIGLFTLAWHTNVTRVCYKLNKFSSLISTPSDFRLSDNCTKFSESIGCLPRLSSDATVAGASREGARTVVRGRKEPRKRRKRGKGRVLERLWKWPLGVVLRKRLTPRHNKRNSLTMVEAEFKRRTQTAVKLAIGAGIYFTLF